MWTSGSALLQHIWYSYLIYKYKYAKKIEIFKYSRDHRRLKKVLKQAGVVHNINPWICIRGPNELGLSEFENSLAKVHESFELC